MLVAAIVSVTSAPEAICVAAITRLPFGWVRGNATIVGRVVDINGRPVRDAGVDIARLDADVDSAETTTGVDGEFRFTNVPPTSYILSAHKRFHVPTLYGADASHAYGHPIEVREASVTSDITLVLHPAGAVEGLITDEFGDPVFEARVFLARRPENIWRGEMEETNDQGRFRIPDVLPGTYVVCVQAPWERLPSRSDTPPGGRNTTTVYAIDCHGGPALENARFFEVRSGETVGDMDIALRPVRTWKVSGAAFDSRGRPIVGQEVGARQWDGNPNAHAARATTDDLGRFVFDGLPPGHYVVRVADNTRPKREAGRCRGDCCDQMSIPVSDQSAAIVRVGEGPVEGVVLKPTDVVPITGRLFFDDDRVPKPKWQRVELTNISGAWQEIEARETTAIMADGSFSLRAEPTTVVVGVRVGDSPWFIKTIRFNGTEVTGKPIDLSSGAGGVLEIHLTTQPNEVTGRGISSDGRPAFGSVVAVSRDPRLRSLDGFHASDEVRLYETFSLKGLLPGDYYLVGLHDLSTFAADDFEDLADRGTLITVGAGERTTADVRIDLLPRGLPRGY